MSCLPHVARINETLLTSDGKLKWMGEGISKQDENCKVQQRCRKRGNESEKGKWNS